MDSKQLSGLKAAAEEAKKPVYVHDLQHICKQKVLINKITMEFLKTQIQLSEASTKLQAYSIQNAKDKIVLVDQLITLFEKQCSQFDPFRQDECMEIYNQLNELNVQPDEINKLISTLGTLDDKLKDLATRIDYFESLIPTQQDGTQYALKKKLPENPQGTCAYEYSNPDLPDDIV